MKKPFVIFLLLIVGCEPDEPPPFHCDMEYHPIPSTHFSFIEEFENYEQLYFRNLSNGSIISFQTIGTTIYQIIDTLNNGTCYTYDYGGIVFTNQSLSKKLIEYNISPEFTEINNFRIKIASFNQPPLCTSSMFYITIDSDTINNDSIEISDKIFYDVYYRTSSGCSSEMYYNKQYGVVGFNWQGEWYVLETDSL